MKSTKAFTLIEVMIVVMIIGLLAILGIVSLRGEIFKGNDAKRKADMNRIGVAVEEYEKDHNCYPSVDFVVCDKPDDNPGARLQPYLNKIPCDPVLHTSYNYEPGPGTCPSWYRLYTGLQNASDTGIIPGIGLGGAYNYYTGSANAPPPQSGISPTPPSTGGPTNFISPTVTGYWGCINQACVPIKLISPGHAICGTSYQTSECINSGDDESIPCHNATNCQ